MEYTDLQPTAFVPRPLKVVVIGAGPSLRFIEFLASRLPMIYLVNFPGLILRFTKKNPDVGGTWYENRYPGCTCDVPSHTYQFSWAPNHNWSQLYPAAFEIYTYLRDTVNQHGLRKFMQFHWRCVSANWDESASKWTTVFGHTQCNEKKVVISDVLVYAVGRLNNYRIPVVEGQDRFQGRIVHTAAWPDDLVVEGARVVVIGNGASAVQCVAALQPVVSKLVNISRGPTWIVPHVLSEDGSVQKDYTAQERRSFQEDQKFYYTHRIGLEQKVATGFSGLWNGTSAQGRFTAMCKSFMESKVKDPALLNALLPDFQAGCRRFTPGQHYLAALQQPNAEYAQGCIGELTDSALITQSGKTYPCDVIVYATGFEPYQPRFPIIGRDGASLDDNWNRRGPCESYMAAMVAQFPNFFAFNPPICPVNGSAIPGIERAANYMIRVLDRLQTDNLSSVSVRIEAQQEFNKWVQSRMAEMVWSGQCSSWYKNDDGKVMVPWPGTLLHYYRATELIRWEDFDLRHRSATQPYGSFGNGLTEDGFVPEKFPWVNVPDESSLCEKKRAITCSLVGHLRASWPCWSIWTISAIIVWMPR
ncbi:uncharacterized protein N7515_009313 [Penicillium bovifimosum]|uniref:L-ornithine N(5)-oxygenase n=1 Tax=Penicillium bovifimosum TaxID=126998 RepID=A0A9W9GJ21_9EURO|nr:uncharacterized protein N7515_009313 [Penicillium bovifimosum]KAJ5121352.1 hypothetical protein N7515_009313 [Penicillium bovifimosum]